MMLFRSQPYANGDHRAFGGMGQVIMARAAQNPVPEVPEPPQRAAPGGLCCRLAEETQKMHSHLLGKTEKTHRNPLQSGGLSVIIVSEV